MLHDTSCGLTGLLLSEQAVCAEDFSNDVSLSVYQVDNVEGKWEIDSSVLVDKKKVSLTFQSHDVVIRFGDGFELTIRSYTGDNDQSLAIEYEPHKEGRPFDGDHVIPRGHFGIIKPHGNQFGYLNVYVNLDAVTKVRI